MIGRGPALGKWAENTNEIGSAGRFETDGHAVPAPTAIYLPQRRLDRPGSRR